MTRDDFKQQLQSLGFDSERYSEFHNDAFLNKDYHGEKIEVFADYYTARIVWWHRDNQKVSKCYSFSSDIGQVEKVEKLLESFFVEMNKTYGQKKT